MQLDESGCSGHGHPLNLHHTLQRFDSFEPLPSGGPLVPPEFTKLIWTSSGAFPFVPREVPLKV